MANKIRIEIVYASEHRQRIIAMDLPVSVTIEQAIHDSKLLQEFPEIDLTKQKIGIFSKFCQLSDWVHDGDRIEIYRPLIIDPKEARRARAKQPP